MQICFASKRFNDGLTLIELLVVLAIVAGLLVVVAPNVYRALPGVEFTSIAKQMTSDLRQIRAHAIESSHLSQFILNVKERTYSRSDEARSVALPKDIDMQLLTGASLLNDSRQGAVVFYPDGSSSGGEVVLSRQDRFYRIRIDWLTGDIRLESSS